MVVGPEPLGGNLLHLLDAFENVQIQPFVPNRPVVALNVGVLLGLAGLDVVNQTGFTGDSLVPILRRE